MHAIRWRNAVRAAGADLGNCKSDSANVHEAGTRIEIIVRGHRIIHVAAAAPIGSRSDVHPTVRVHHGPRATGETDDADYAILSESTMHPVTGLQRQRARRA